jgi:hypothetical protein
MGTRTPSREDEIGQLASMLTSYNRAEAEDLFKDVSTEDLLKIRKGIEQYGIERYDTGYSSGYNSARE